MNLGGVVCGEGLPLGSERLVDAGRLCGPDRGVHDLARPFFARLCDRHLDLEHARRQLEHAFLAEGADQVAGPQGQKRDAGDQHARCPITVEDSEPVGWGEAFGAGVYDVAIEPRPRQQVVGRCVLAVRVAFLHRVSAHPNCLVVDVAPGLLQDAAHPDRLWVQLTSEVPNRLYALA